MASKKHQLQMFAKMMVSECLTRVRDYKHIQACMKEALENDTDVDSPYRDAAIEAFEGLEKVGHLMQLENIAKMVMQLSKDVDASDCADDDCSQFADQLMTIQAAAERAIKQGVELLPILEKARKKIAVERN